MICVCMSPRHSFKSYDYRRASNIAAIYEFQTFIVKMWCGTRLEHFIPSLRRADAINKRMRPTIFACFYPSLCVICLLEAQFLYNRFHRLIPSLTLRLAFFVHISIVCVWIDLDVLYGFATQNLIRKSFRMVRRVKMSSSFYDNITG